MNALSSADRLLAGLALGEPCSACARPIDAMHIDRDGDLAYSPHRRAHRLHRWLAGQDARASDYSLSKPWFVNFSARLFSVTVRTT